METNWPEAIAGIGVVWAVAFVMWAFLKYGGHRKNG